MKTKFLTFIFLALASSVFADAEFNTLKKQYEDAVARNNKIYVEGLHKLLEKHKSAKNNDEAQAVVVELRKFEPATPDAISADVMNADVTRQFAGKTFNNRTGASYEFKKDGTGIKRVGAVQMPFVWTVEKDMVKVVGSHMPNVPPKPLWFKMTDRKTGLYGNSADVLSFPFDEAK